VTTSNGPQTAIRIYPRFLQIGVQKPVEGELKGLIWLLPIQVSTSGRHLGTGPSMNTGDAYLLLSYHRVLNRKSGLKPLYAPYTLLDHLLRDCLFP